MKKIILFLLLSAATYAQQTNFPYGIKNPAATIEVSPTMITTHGPTNVYGKVSVNNLPVSIAVQDSLDKKLNISDLPSNLTLYPTTVASDVSGYVVMVTDIHDVRYDETAVNVSTPSITTTDQLVSSRISDAAVLVGQPGVFNATSFGNIRRLSGSGTANFYFEIYKRTAAGVETLIGISGNSAPVSSSSYLEFTASLVWDDGTFIATDRIVVKSYANRISGGTNPVYQFQFGGLTPVRTVLPVPFSVVDAGYEIKDNKQNSLAVDGTGEKYPTVDAVNAEAVKTTVTTTNGYIPQFTGAKTISNSNFYTDSSFPALYLPLFPTPFESKSTILGNANGVSGYKKSLIITDNTDVPVFLFDNDGRLDLKSYSGNGGISCLYNMAATPTYWVGHYAFAARDSAGNLHTVGILGSRITDNTTTSIDSEIRLEFLKNANGTGAYLQPNSSVVINGDGFFIPDIPITSLSGNQEFVGSLSTNAGIIAEAQIKSNNSLAVVKDGSDSVAVGSNLVLAQTSDSNQNIFQLNASNGVDIWNYDTVRGSFQKGITFDKNGKIKSKAFYFEGTEISEPVNGGDYTQIKIQPTSGNKDAVFQFAPSGTSTTSVMEFYAESTLAGSNRGIVRNTNGNLSFGSDLSNTPISFIQSNNQKLGVDSSGKIVINDTPSTSAGTYDILTRNTSTGVVERINTDIALTGTPTAPTATVGTNTTQIATTAFVLANGVSLSANNTFTGENTFSNHTILGAPIVLKSYIVATLPEGLQGDFAFVTDALAPAYMATVVGGGAVVTPVFYNGTNWVAH